MLDLEGYDSETLRTALRILGPNGEYWTKRKWRILKRFPKEDGVGFEKKPCFCAEGALAASLRPKLLEPIDMSEHLAQPSGFVKGRKLLRFFESAIGIGIGAVPSKNDAYWDWPDVKKHFEIAIAKAEEKERTGTFGT